MRTKTCTPLARLLSGALLTFGAMTILGAGACQGSDTADTGAGPDTNTSSSKDTAPRGMNMPWIEQQAEDAQTNAKVIGPSRVKWDANHIEAEAIGRKAVRLDKTGDYVAFKTTKAANSIVVRFSIPDAPQGGGIDATLGLYVGGKRVKSLPLTSRYAWSYKGGLIGDAIVDKPAEQPHTFFDETRMLLDEIPVGAEVKLQRDDQDNAPFYIIDLVDFEEVAPPLTMPAGFTSVTDLGIMPNDGKDHADDILKAVGSYPKLWFPPGEYLAQKISGGNIGLDNPGHEIRGAGMWHTTLKGAKAMFFCAGANAKCVYGDFSIFGESKARAEETQGVQKAFAGPLGKDSLIENLWIEHEVAAIWVGNDPPYQDTPTDGLHIQNVRIRDVYADGINLANGTSNSLVENCHMRNTGDDATVVWSIKWTDWVREKTYALGDGFINPQAKNAPDQGVGHGNTFRKISAQMPWRANCFAAYGGNDNHWEDSTCEDVLTYPGIFVDNEFSPYPFGPGLTTFKNISLARAGGPMFFEETQKPWEHGALKFYMREGDVNDILVEDVDIIDPTYAGIEFRGFGSAYVPPGEKFEPGLLADADKAKFSNVTLKNVTVTNAGTFGIQIMDGGGRGTVNFDHVVVQGSSAGALDRGGAPDAFFTMVGGNTGWGAGGPTMPPGTGTGTGTGTGGTGGKGFYIQSVWKGTYLFDKDKQVAYGSAMAGDAYAWVLEDQSGFKRIKNVGTGRYMNIEGQLPYVESTSVADTFYSGYWTIEEVPNGTKRLRNAWKGTYLNVESQSGAAQVSDFPADFTSTQWLFVQR